MDFTMLVHSTTAEAENLLPSMMRKGNTRTLNWDFLKGENRKGEKKMDVKGKRKNGRGRKVGREEDRGKRREIWDVR